jgi:S1-C subfamily serine protease
MTALGTPRVLIPVAALALLAATPVHATDMLVLRIECDGAQGSGVIVSAAGDVLTAKHVVCSGTTCVARIGDTGADPIPLVDPVPHPELDAVRFRLETDANLPFARVCPVAELIRNM